MQPCLGIIYMTLNKGVIQPDMASYSHYFKDDYSKAFHLFSPLGRVSLVVAMSLCFFLCFMFSLPCVFYASHCIGQNRSQNQFPGLLLATLGLYIPLLSLSVSSCIFFFRL